MDAINGVTNFQKGYSTKLSRLSCLLQICDEAIAEICYKCASKFSAAHETSAFTRFNKVIQKLMLKAVHI